jgi:SAM-dependent methyltransferase
LTAVPRLLRPPARVLEIGAGSGWQARELAVRGYEVEAVDIASPRYANSRVWPVIEYDGRTLPFPEGVFDCIFSSNVLEHVEDLPQLFAEMRRVLKHDGQVVHLVPTASWRLWTSLLHYPRMAVRVIERARNHLLRRPDMDVYGQRSTQAVEVSRLGSRWRYLLRIAFAERHGAHHNALWELYGFSRWRWARTFAGWRGLRLVRHRGGIYYSGNLLLGRVLPIGLRTKLSWALGSSCHVFVGTAGGGEDCGR